MDRKDLERLYDEVTLISRRVGLLKSIVLNADDPAQREMFQKEIKRLQEQAVFYMEKIKELENGDVKNK